MGNNRIQSEAEIYHVVSRGTGRQLIFEDDDDRHLFLGLLRRNTRKYEVEVLAWCLMGNHIHLLLHGPLSKIGACMRDVLGTYSKAFNGKYERVGHLFQNRFRSDSIDSDEYLLAVVRYIHQNPVKAGFSPSCSWSWSSYGEYVGDSCHSICDTKFVLGCFGGLQQFCRLHEKAVKEACLDCDGGRFLSDDEILALASGVLGEQPVSSLKKLPLGRRNSYLSSLKEAGLTIKQIERLTGIGRGSINRALAAGKVSPDERPCKND